ncbi:BRCT protein [Venustampulla echinocandica]|uniref:BRCT protein n=1 Tax=Venustampulla echinocandica TaxID=2656787 RepID=A0A370U2K3_9HELO|nr:BRCT protein [Venustampulla echinocandica]RDL42012.1 BRCT protein [Venustampulla echinocandica]
MAMAAEKGAPLFEHLVFSIVPSRDLIEAQIVGLQGTIEDHKGEVLAIKRNGKIDLDNVTHIIAATSDFPQYLEARQNMICIVRPSWVTESLLKRKPAQTRPHSPDPNLFFSTLVITCADIPSGDKAAVAGAVVALGGMESSSLTKLTTHICALTMDHPKCQQAVERNLKCQIVLPHWFDDCLKLGKKIDERPYLLPNPEILRVNPDDAVPLPTESTNIQGASSPRPESLPLPTDSPRHLDVFQSKTVMMSGDLEIGSRLRKVLEDLVIDGGGAITHSVHSADMFICQWRDGRDYVFASCAGIDVGNLAWLYHLITHNEWTSPLRRLLHYPLPRGGIPGFEEFRITLSNYGGEARTYLENLVLAAGAEFTKSMKVDNTHLITARKSSEKCNAADEWNINMVNHLWIEESYARCKMQELTDPRYTHFPPRTNLGEVIGQTQFDPKVLKAAYFPKDPTPGPDDPKPLSRPVMQEKDSNLSSPRKSDDDTAMGSQDENNDQEDEHTGKAEKKGHASLPKSRATTAANVSTPSAKRRISTGRGNSTPSSSRSAKQQAVLYISGMAGDIALYEKEKKRKGPIWGGERAANQIDKQRSLERSSSPAQKEEDGYSDEETRTPKRQRISLPPISIKLLVTGYQAWVNNPTKEDMDKKKLRELGIQIVQDPKKCTHLAAPAMVRTKKFLCALAMGPTIVRSDFIDACIKTGEVPDAEDFNLKDSDNEKKFKLKLKDVGRRAKANKRSLLKRVPIYCTQDIPNGPETYEDIVKANGGIFAIYNGKPTIKKTNPAEDEIGPEPVYLITGQKPTERKLWPSFAAMARDGNMLPRIVTTDWILDVAMAQQQKWDDSYLAEGQ